MKTITLLTCFVALSLNTIAQCDPELYEKMKKELPGTIFLKRYSIESKGSDNVSFVREYSYVLISENVYAFYLENSPENSNPYKLDFSLTDNEGNSLNSLLENKEIDGKKIWTFLCPATGVYFFTLHNQESGKICSALQLSFYPRSNPQPCDIALYKKIETPDAKGWDKLKNYSVGNKKDAKFSYILSKDRGYQIYIQQTGVKKPDVTFELLNNDDAPSTIRIIKMEHDAGGVSYLFDVETTGIYWFNFKLKDEGMCAVAQLSFQYKE